MREEEKHPCSGHVGEDTVVQLSIMTGMKTTSDIPGKHEAWLRSWLDAADEAVRQAPAGRSAREELAADRNRLEPVIHRSAR